MSNTFQRDHETWFTYFLLSIFGYFLNILGPITPFLREELNTTYTVAGLHFSAFAIGMFIAGLIGDQVLSRFGYRKTLWASAIGISAGTIGLISSHTVWLTISASFCMGLLGSFILVLIPSMLSLKYKQQSAIALTELNTVASLVSMLAPLLVGIFATSFFGWRFGLILAILALLMMGITYRKLNFNTFPLPQRTAKKQAHLPIRYWAYWLGIFFVVAVEFCFIFWGSDYLIVVTKAKTEIASASISLFLGAMLLGRWLGSRILRVTKPKTILFISLSLAMIGFFVFWSSSLIWVSLSGFFLAGFGVANLYPISLDHAISSVPASQSSKASARSALASASAILSLPLILGNLADQNGMRTAFMIVPGIILAAFILNTFLAKRPNPGKITQQENLDL